MFRRHVRIVANGSTITGELEDDFHHVHVVLEHDGERISACRGETERIPWTTCPAAAGELGRFVGMKLSPSLLESARHSDPRLHCTHLFDVASLAVAHAARAGSAAPMSSRERARLYEVAIPDRVEGRTRATLSRDGEPLLEWEIREERIMAPQPFAGREIFRGGFAPWAERALDPETAEAALLLHRACTISLGRSFDLDRVERATAFSARTSGYCYTFGPEQIERARRNVGTTRDFTTRPEDLLSD